MPSRSAPGNSNRRSPADVLALPPPRGWAIFRHLGEVSGPAQTGKGPTVSVTVRQLADWIGGEVVGDGDVPIRAARPLTEAGPDDITFVDGDKHLPSWHASPAAAAIVP